jgi:hypothetical protein
LNNETKEITNKGKLTEEELQKARKEIEEKKKQNEKHV